MVLGGANAQEQEALRDRMENDEQDSRPNSLGSAHTGACGDETEVGDRGVRKHALGVALGDGHKRAQREREPADEHHHHGGHQAHREDRRELHEQEHARLDHCGGMQQSRCRRRGDHRAEQPCMEGHLRGFRDARKREQSDGQHDKRREGATELDEHREGKRQAENTQIYQGELERNAAKKVHHDLTERVVDGFFGLRKPDEQEGAQRGDLPRRVHPRHVVDKDDVEHGREEREHNREEPRTAIARLRVLMQLVSLEILHVA